MPGHDNMPFPRTSSTSVRFLTCISWCFVLQPPELLCTACPVNCLAPQLLHEICGFQLNRYTLTNYEGFQTIVNLRSASSSGFESGCSSIVWTQIGKGPLKRGGWKWRLITVLKPTKTGRAGTSPHKEGESWQESTVLSAICFLLYFKGAVKCIYTQVLSLQGKQLPYRLEKWPQLSSSSPSLDFGDYTSLHE